MRYSGGMNLLALYLIFVALVWIGTKVDALSKHIESLAEATRGSKQI